MIGLGMNEFLLGQEVKYRYEDGRNNHQIKEGTGVVVAVAYAEAYSCWKLLIRDITTNLLESCSHYAITINPS